MALSNIHLRANSYKVYVEVTVHGQLLFHFDVLYINGCYFSVVFTADMEKLQQENRWLFSSVCVIDISTKIQEDL